MINKVFASFMTSIKDVDLIREFTNVNNERFSSAFLLGGEPSYFGGYNIRIRSKEAGYHWINIPLWLGRDGYIMEWDIKGDLFTMWLTETFGSLVVKNLNGMISYGSSIENCESPSFQDKYPRFNDFLTHHKKSMDEYKYVIPSNVLEYV